MAKMIDVSKQKRNNALVMNVDIVVF